MTRARTVVAAGVALHINGKVYGRVTSFSWSSATPRTPKYGIDSTDPFEMMPTITRVQGRIGLVRTVGDGGAEGAAIATRFANLPREKYFSLALVETKSDTVLFEANSCSVISQSWQVPTKGLVTGEVEFTALDWNNEVRPYSP